MNQNQEYKGLMGTGTGKGESMGVFHVSRLLRSLQDIASARHAPRWSGGFRLIRPATVAARWGVRADGHKGIVPPAAEVAEAPPLLSPLELAEARAFVARESQAASLRMGFSAIVGTEAGGVDAAALACALSRLESVLAWGERVGAVDAQAIDRAEEVLPELAEARRARREQERAMTEARRAAVGLELARIRAARRQDDTCEASRLGTEAAQAARAAARAGARPASLTAAEVPARIGGPLERLTIPHGSAAGLAALRLSVAGFVPLGKLRKRGVRVNRHHKRRARKLSALLAPLGLPSDAFTLGQSARVAEIRARKWARGQSSTAAAERGEIGGAAGADDMGAFYVRLLQEVSGIYRGAALESAGRMLSTLRGAGVRLNRNHRRQLALGRSVCGVTIDGNGRERSHRGLASLSAALVEGWEYKASRARDGREVGGGWAMQGAIHGLRDFSLVDCDGYASAVLESGDDAEAVTLPEVSRAESGAARPVPSSGVELGQLRNRPTSGAGTGPRPSVLAGLDGMAEGIRNAFAARVRAANRAGSVRIVGAAANAVRAEESAARSLELVEGLACWLRDGEGGPDAATVAEFFTGSGEGINATGRKRLQRLRERGGVESGGAGPARAAVLRRWSYRGEVADKRGNVHGVRVAWGRGFVPESSGDEVFTPPASV